MKFLRRMVALAGLLAAVTGLLLLPGIAKLPPYRPITLDDVTTIDDAVDHCRRTGLHGWDLVAYAQQLVYRKFTWYSTRNLWDAPARAFAHGMGYCTQYNLALQAILNQLGFATQAVYCMRVRVNSRPNWTLGHTWLRVRYGSEERDVCAGHADNLPGRVGFEPLAPVHCGSYALLMLFQFAMIPYCGVVEWRAFLRGENPGWTLVRR